MKILGGDWPGGGNASLTRSGGKVETLQLFRDKYAWDAVPAETIESAEIVTQENQKSILKKMGWGAVGLVTLGPLGMLAGVLGGGNRNSMVMAIKFSDGRAVLLEGKSKDLQPLLGVAFSKQHKN
jgi:hypothetical protein